MAGHCVAPLPTDRRRARCDLALQGSFSVAGKAGVNSVRLSGRLDGVALGAGRYWLRAAPRDAAGNAGEAKRAAITIVRRTVVSYRRWPYARASTTRPRR